MHPLPKIAWMPKAPHNLIPDFLVFPFSYKHASHHSLRKKETPQSQKKNRVCVSEAAKDRRRAKQKKMPPHNHSLHPLPPALTPSLHLPLREDAGGGGGNSLVLLTSTLACSVNWVVARYVGCALKGYAAGAGEGEVGGGEGDEMDDTTMGMMRPVVLVSWVQDERFWRSEIKRGAVG